LICAGAGASALSACDIRRITLRMAVLVVALGASLAAPASADNREVLVRDFIGFTPTKAAVKPSESVTWNQQSTSGQGHNVVFEDGQFSTPVRTEPWIATRTFAAAGTFPYYCSIHRQFGMTGVVYVNATGTVPPVAAFTVSPNPAVTGQTVSFNGSGSGVTTGSIVKYEWDLDGNGSFETDTGATPTTSRSYTSPATLNVKLRATDNNGINDQTTRTLQVNAAPPPTSRFTVSPNPALTAQTVSFDGSGSSATNGSIVKYEWDLDGDGSFETDTGATPTTSRSYTSPATLSAKLRVTDNNGSTNETTRSLQINAAPEPQPITQLQPGPIPIVTPVAEDVRAPLVTLGGTLAQSVKLGFVSVVVQPDEAASLSGSGTAARPALRATSRASAAARAEKAKNYRLQSTKAVAKARQKVTLRLRLSKSAIKAVKQGLARGRRSTARVSIVATDAAGNKRTVKRQIRITK